MTTDEATYENEHLFRADSETYNEYQAYLAEHDAYRMRGGILYADDFVTWLNFDRWGKEHRDRVLANNP